MVMVKIMVRARKPISTAAKSGFLFYNILVAKSSNRIANILGLEDAERAKLMEALIFTALHGMQSRYSDGNSVYPSVRLSVCPSVKRVHCDKTEESYV